MWNIGIIWIVFGSGGVPGDGGDGGGDSGAEAEPPSHWGYGRDYRKKLNWLSTYNNNYQLYISITWY